MFLKDARTREKGLFDLLTWEMIVKDGVIRTVDGALLTTLEYRGPDLDSATGEELSSLSATLAKILTLLGDGWMIHAEALRVPAPAYPAASHFPDEATQAIDDARKTTYESGRGRYYSRYYLTLTHKPNVMKQGLLRFAPTGEKEEIRRREDRTIEIFEDTVADVRRQLQTHLRVHPLSTEALVRYLHTALTCRDQPVQIPGGAFTLESLFGAAELHGGTELQVSDQHVVPISIINYPDGTTPAALACLDELALPYRASFRYIRLDPYTAKAAISSKRQKWSTAGISMREILAFAFGGADAKPKFRDRHAPAMAQDADDALARLDSTESSAGYLTSTILTFDPDRGQAVDQANEIVKELRNAGFIALMESYNALEAFLGSLPGHGAYNQRRPIVPDRGFVDIAPTTAVWSGQAENPHPALKGQGPCIVAATEGATPFFWSLSVGDVQHAVVAGPVGAGKSTLVNLMIAQYLRYEGAQVFSFDKGWSQAKLCEAAGGHHYAPAADRPDGDRFAPLAHVDNPADRTQAADWIEDLLQLQGVEFDPHKRSAVQRALKLLAGTKRRTLSAFAAKLQHTELRAALAPYVGDGNFGHLFGAERSPLRDGHLHVIEMEALLGLREKALTPVITHLFREIERRLDGRPTLLVIEEAPNYLADSLFALRFRQWLLELRKRNTGVVLVTQLLSTLLASELRDAVLENCPTRVFLPSSAARDPHAASAYRDFGLNSRQVDLIAQATPKCDYYLDTPAGSRMIRLNLSAKELEILGHAAPPEGVA